MRLEDIAPGQDLEGIVPSSSAHVLVVHEPAPGTRAVIYRDASGALGERLLGRVDEPFVCVPARERPWAFDVAGDAFKQALEVCMEVSAAVCRTDATARERTEAFLLVRRGAFLVDPGLKGLGPYMLLVLGHGPGPGPDADGRRAMTLVRAGPSGCLAVADPATHRRLMATRPEDRPLLEEALQPLLANARLRTDAISWQASRMLAERGPSAVGPTMAPPRALEPPVIHGAAAVASPWLLPWLRQHGSVPAGES